MKHVHRKDILTQPWRPSGQKALGFYPVELRHQTAEHWMMDELPCWHLVRIVEMGSQKA